MGLVDTSPIGFQSYVFWVPVPEVEVSKVGVLDVPFTPQGEAGHCKFPPPQQLVVAELGEGFMARVSFSISLPILMWVFSLFTQYLRSHSAYFWISFRRNCSMYRCRVIVPAGGNEFGKPRPPSWTRTPQGCIFLYVKKEYRNYCVGCI